MSESDFVADGNYAWEFWYQFQVTDNISVTPAIYYLSRPLGDLTMVVNGIPGGESERDLQQLRRSREDHLQVLISFMSEHSFRVLT